MLAQEFVGAYGEARASAILRTSHAEVAGAAMEAAVAGGFRIVEFTLTTPGALQLIADFATRPDVIVGAGTVLTTDEAQAAVDAGADFLVSPVLDLEVVRWAAERNVAMMPGTYTATEMLAAHRAGAPLCKLFPAPGTGAAYVKSILAPLPMLRIVPTNGVHENNAAAYLGAGAFAVGFTTALFDANDLAAAALHRVEEKARRLLAAIASARENVAKLA